ncbi:hypothetical protein JTB14_034562 [Gonioctena quinquepunctata]|nr:hypothetical protein JTB14_034562 [Gonioctena quinquepunctata]
MLRSDQDKDQVKTIEPKQGNSQLIKTTDVAASILQEQSKLKMNHLIHLAEVPSTAGEEDMDSRNREDWRTVLPRRNRNKNKKGQMIIGDNKDSELVKAVPTFVDLHVTRMKTDTTETSLSNLPKETFPEVILGHGEGNVLLRMVKVKLYGNNTVLETVALCDEASSVTLVDKSIANRLGLDGTPQPLCIQWTNNLSSRHEDSSCLKFKISGIFSGAKMFSMKNVRTVENLALPVQEIRRSDWERYSHLEGILFHEISERPMILLGQDNIHLTVARKVIQSTENLLQPKPILVGFFMEGIRLNKKSRHIPSTSAVLKYRTFHCMKW